MSKTDDQPVTKKDLIDALSSQEVRLTESVIGSIRDEMDSKLNAMETRLVDAMAEQSQTILQAVGEMVEPMQADAENHGKRIAQLEAKAA